MTTVAALLLSVALAAPAPEALPSKSTFCVEWVRQSREGYERMTLFSDRTVVWKTSDARGEEVRRKRVSPDELAFYCSYFSRREFWDLPDDLRSGLGSEFVGQSSVTLARSDGFQKRVRFDDLSALSADAGGLRAALDGLKTIFTNPLAPASRFTPDVLAPGTILKRFDGEVFRIRRLEKEKGFVELVGVVEPYSQFVKIEELRYQFSPPE